MEVVCCNIGGGVIYIDDNFVNVCYLILYDEKDNILGNYDKFYELIIKMLKELGVKDVV